MSYFGIPIRNGAPIGLGALAPLASQAAAAPSLSLNFTSGVLDSRVTFTRASTGTYYNSSGVLTSAAINEARFDYNPTTMVPLGLLIEEQRVNSIRNNTGVGAVAGTPGTPPTNCSFTGAATGLTRTLSIGSENGISYVDIKYVGTASGSTFAFFNTDSPSGIAAATGQVWNGSFYLKLAAGSTAGVDIKMSLLELNSGGSGVVQSLSPILTPTSANLSTHRNTLTATLSGGATVTNLQQGLRLLFTDGPIDITLRIGLPQLELGSFATSVIPTTTAAATRAADNSLITGTNFSSWYNATEGTLCTSVVTATTTTVGAALSINDNTSSNAIQIYYFGSAQYQVVTGGVSQATLAATSTGTFKAAGAYKVNAFAASFNGAAATTDTSGTIPTVSQLRIGALGGGSSHLNGTIKYIAYYPRRLSNAQLQALTV